LLTVILFTVQVIGVSCSDKKRSAVNSPIENNSKGASATIRQTAVRHAGLGDSVAASNISGHATRILNLSCKQ